MTKNLCALALVIVFGQSLGEISYTAHISNGKSSISTKAKLKSVAKHNLRKYRSADYSQQQVVILKGTDNLFKDVQDIYHREFDAALAGYNAKQSRKDRKIENYFDHVANLSQDLAVEMIVQFGSKGFWDEFKSWRGESMTIQGMKDIYGSYLEALEKLIPDFKIANVVIHFDEASPHMHVVGVPVAGGYKKGMSKQVSKRKVFTSEVLGKVLQDELRKSIEWRVDRNRCSEFEQMQASVAALVSTLEMIQFNDKQMARLKVESDFLEQVKRRQRQRGGMTR